MSTFATGPQGPSADAAALEADLGTAALSEQTGRAILLTLGQINAQLDQIRRFTAKAAGELPGNIATPSL